MQKIHDCRYVSISAPILCGTMCELSGWKMHGAFQTLKHVQSSTYHLAMVADVLPCSMPELVQIE